MNFFYYYFFLVSQSSYSTGKENKKVKEPSKLLIRTMAYACPPRNTSCKMSQSISQSNKKQQQQQLFMSLLTYANAITAGTVTGRTTSSGNGLGNFTRKQENGTDELRISIYQGDNKCDYWKDFWVKKKLLFLFFPSQ